MEIRDRNIPAYEAGRRFRDAIRGPGLTADFTEKTQRKLIKFNISDEDHKRFLETIEENPIGYIKLELPEEKKEDFSITKLITDIVFKELRWKNELEKGIQKIQEDKKFAERRLDKQFILSDIIKNEAEKIDLSEQLKLFANRDKSNKPVFRKKAPEQEVIYYHRETDKERQIRELATTPLNISIMGVKDPLNIVGRFEKQEQSSQSQERYEVRERERRWKENRRK